MSCGGQWAVQPPSTGSAVPVIEAAPGEHRNTASAPSSSTVAKRLLGWFLSSTSRTTWSRRDAVRPGLVVDLLLDQRRPDIARADGVAGDAGLGQLQGRDLGQADQAVLGGDVGRLEGRGDQAVRRGDVDDPAPAPRRHARDHRAHGVEGGREVDGQDLVPLGGREALDRRHVLDAGIVDQDVDRTQLAHGLGDHGRDLLGPAHVRAAVRHGDAELLLQPVAQAGDGRGVAEAVEHEVGAGGGQRPGDAQADAAGRAGDDGTLAGERASGGGGAAGRGGDVHGGIPRGGLIGAWRMRARPAGQKCRVRTISIRRGYRRFRVRGRRVSVRGG